MSDDYLTMARIMNDERTKFVQQHTQFRNMTGMEQIWVKEAYNAGFMAGFEGKYFSSEK
jgi:hypothetical protein